MSDTSFKNNDEKKEYIINELGLQIARENIARQTKELLDDKNQKDFKEKLLNLMKDRDEIDKGNMEVIKKYVGELNIG